MAVSAPDLSGYTIAQLLEELHSGMVGSTQDLARFTRDLVKATWALFFVAGATVLLTVVRVLKASGWMQ